MFFFFYLSRIFLIFFFFSSRRRHTRSLRDWSSDVCSSDLTRHAPPPSRTSTGTMGGKGLNIYKPFPELYESAPARSKARSVVRVSKQSRRSLSSVPQEFAPVPLR